MSTKADSLLPPAELTDPAPASVSPTSVPDRAAGAYSLPSAKTPLNQRHSSNTFYRSCEISVMEPVGSMSISPANRDVVLAARKGLFIIDLEDPFAPPRFLAHMTTWEAVDIQWSPHPARSNWVASTSNQKLLIWNLDRPSDSRTAPEQARTPVRSSIASGSSIVIPLGSQSAYHRATTYHSMHNSLGAQSGTTASGAYGAKSSLSNLGHVFPAHYHAAAPRSSAIEHVLHAHTRAITDINWSPFHPEMVASSSIDTWTWVWDLRMSGTSGEGGRCKPAQGYSAWNAAVTQVKFNRASEHRLASTCDNKVLIWDDRKGSLPLATIEAHESKIYGIDWSRDTSLGLDKLVTCSLDTTVKFWDLGSETSQAAIGARQLITEPESTIKTNTPVWRARHLPFGDGVMTLPQRGDTTLSMWGKDKPEEPQATFVGHSDIVKEYLFRTKGGQNRESDNRQFQLLTWSKDQTLRLWPVTDEQTRRVGHRPDAPIRVLMTRSNAPDISYRDPPAIYPSQEGDDDAVVSKSLGSGSNLAASSILPPGRVTRALLSGKGSANVLSPASPHSSSASGFHTGLRDGKPSPVAPFSSSLGTGGARFGGLSPNHSAIVLGTNADIARSPNAGLGKSWTNTGRRNSEHLARSVPKDKGSSRFTSSYQSGGSSSFKVPSSRLGGSKAATHATIKTRPLQQRHHSGRPLVIQEEHSAHQEESSATAASEVKEKKKKAKSKMSTSARKHRAGGTALGAAMRLDRGRMTGPAVDPVEWIANVRMEKEDSHDTDAIPVSSSVKGHGHNSAAQLVAALSKEGMGTEEDTDAEPGLTSQRLGDEIVAINRQLPRIVFEKVDVAKRSCVLTMYGPWADHEPAFLRVIFSFPRSYPRQAPKFDLEKNASISLKTRAYLLKGLSRLSTKAALAGRPSIEVCARFLIGEPIKSLDDDGRGTDEEAERSTSRGGGSFESSSESEEDDLPGLSRALHTAIDIQPKVKAQLPARRMGATFGPNNELVVFGGQHQVDESRISSMQPSRSASRTRNDGKQSRSRSAVRGEIDGVKPSVADADDGSRFLRSYTALSSAMTSLAKFSKTASEDLGGQAADYGVRDSDVVQLMSTDFFARRLLQKSDFFDDFGDQPATKARNQSHYTGSGASTPGARRSETHRRPAEEDNGANTLHHADLRGALRAPAAILTLNRLKKHRRRRLNSTVQIYTMHST